MGIPCYTETRWAKGYNQHTRMDYKKNLSPIVGPTKIKMVLTIAVMQEWPLRQLDINNVFLREKLTETVYTMQPPRFKDPAHPNYVCSLNKAIYNLKQAL